MDPALGSVRTRAQEGSRVLQMEDFISAVLRVGVVLSAAIVGIGLVMVIVHGTGFAGYPTTISGVIAGILTLNPKTVVDLGLLLLIATPVIRVGMSVAIFVYERDYLYAAVTLFVLLVLLISFTLGKVE
ncbi:MAG: DUF1634 domain-containing protein [Actinobacteria bacterium]|nr:DUF1634 domain-containing protein [Actinomycetota bacterium]